MRAVLTTLAVMTLPLPALGQQVIVRTTPPRATLVCDGQVIGVTPVAVIPQRARTCTLFARGHANLAFDPAALTGAIASFRLDAVPPNDDLACGAIDPRTGLVRVCFDEDEGPRHARRRGSCGHIDPETGLMMVCFSNTPTRAPAREALCGRINPTTGLMHVCLGEPVPRRRSTTPAPVASAPRRPPAVVPPAVVPPAVVPPSAVTAAPSPGCGQVNPTTGLMHICFEEPSPPRRHTLVPSTSPSSAPPQGRRCGHLDALTGLLDPCFE